MIETADINWLDFAHSPEFDSYVMQMLVPNASAAAVSRIKDKIISGEISPVRSHIEAALRAEPDVYDMISYPDEKISVIVPCYGVEDYLDRCMESLLNQTHQNLEIILVDDGSPDNCGIMCDHYAETDSRVKVIHRENGGLSAARNSGLDIATGDYIGFVDSDDYIDLDMYEYLLDGLHKYDAQISSCMESNISTWVTRFRNNETNPVMTGDEFVRMLFADEIENYAWNKLYTRSLWNEVRFPEGLNFEDIVTTYKVARLADHVVLLNKHKYNYMIRSSSISGVRTYKNRLHIYTAIITRYKEAVPYYPQYKLELFMRIRKYYIHELSYAIVHQPQTRPLSMNLLKLLSDFVREVMDEQFATGDYSELEKKKIRAFAEGTISGCKKSLKAHSKLSKEEKNEYCKF